MAGLIPLRWPPRRIDKETAILAHDGKRWIYTTSAAADLWSDCPLRFICLGTVPQPHEFDPADVEQEMSDAHLGRMLEKIKDKRA